MITTDYFYRKIGTAEFEHSDVQRTVLPVRLKNPFVRRTQYFCLETHEWIACDDNFEAAASSAAVPEEYAETAVKPEYPDFDSDCILNSVRPEEEKAVFEDLDASQMAEYLAFKNNLKRFKFNRQNQYDEKGYNKDSFGIKIESDDEKLTLRITVQRFRRIPADAMDSDRTSPALVDCNLELEEEHVFFDVKNGVFEIGTDGDTQIRRMYKNINARIDARRFDYLRMAAFRLPQKIFRLSWEKLTALAQTYTGLSYKSLQVPLEKICVQEMAALTMLPYEHTLYSALVNMEDGRRRKKLKACSRRDPHVFKKFCKAMKIRNTRTVRRRYNENPETLLVYMNLYDCGFRDINFYNRVLEDSGFCNYFRHCDKTVMFFSRYSIKKRGERATLNMLLNSIDESDAEDCFSMFYQYFKYIPGTLRKDILEDGFTEYNHDALSKISQQHASRTVVFKYKSWQKKLCGTVSGYEFCLPKDSGQLREIGAALHNCVASYKDYVLDGTSTIVYAQKDGGYKICIEIRGNKIAQALADYNRSLSKEEEKSVDEWWERRMSVCPSNSGLVE